MDGIFQVVEGLLPLGWMQYEFMKHAFLAILIITPLFGLLGTMIVNNRMAFFSEALGHSAFTGIAIGVIFGLGDTNVSMVIFAIIFALALNKIKRMKTISTDTIISVFASLSTSIGLVILSKGGNFAKYSTLLVGDILSISEREILLLLVVFIATFVFWIVAFNQLHALSINEALAKSKGIPVVLIDNLFVILIAVIVMLSIKWVGILIINALLILPAAASRNLASDMREYHIFSVAIAMFSGILGLMLSYYNATATGPTIVIVSSVIFFATLVVRRYVKQ